MCFVQWFGLFKSGEKSFTQSVCIAIGIRRQKQLEQYECWGTKKKTHVKTTCILVQNAPAKFSFSVTNNKSGQIQIKIQPHFIKGIISVRFWLWPSTKSPMLSLEYGLHCYQKATYSITADTHDWLTDWMTLGSSPYSPDAPRPYGWDLCAS